MTTTHRVEPGDAPISPDEVRRFIALLEEDLRAARVETYRLMPAEIGTLRVDKTRLIAQLRAVREWQVGY